MSLIESSKYLRDPEYRERAILRNADVSSVFEGARLDATDSEVYREAVSSAPRRRASSKKRSSGA